MYLGKVNSFLKCFKCTQLNHQRPVSKSQESRDILHTCLGIPVNKAQSLISSHKLSKISKENLKETCETLKSFGYTDREIIDYANLLSKPPNKLRDQYLVLQEVGFSGVTPIALLNFRKLIHKTIKVLKQLSFLPPDCNVATNLIGHLNPKPEDVLKDYVYSENDIVAQLHGVIIKRYLQWRLEATSGEIETFFRIHKAIKFKSFQYICKNIEFAQSIGFTTKKLLTHGYLLTNNPSYPEEIIKQIPSIGNLDMKIAMQRYPRLIIVHPEKFMEIYNILKTENIPDESICQCMTIFYLSPEMIKMRFQEIKQIPQLNVLRTNPRVLKLIIHHNRARSRLSFMQELNLKCCGMSMLQGDKNEHFDALIKSGRDTNNYGDVAYLLQNLLNAKSKDIRVTLKKHPHHLEISLLEIEKSVKFLQKKFSNAAIIKVLPIVLYPRDKLASAYKEVSLMKKVADNDISEIKKLNMMLYVIEKRHHFTGDGVWDDN